MDRRTDRLVSEMHTSLDQLVDPAMIIITTKPDRGTMAHMAYTIPKKTQTLLKKREL